MCFKGDSKLINSKGRLASWKSSAVIMDIESLSVGFEFCCFTQVLTRFSELQIKPLMC